MVYTTEVLLEKDWEEAAKVVGDAFTEEPLSSFGPRPMVFIYLLIF